MREKRSKWPDQGNLADPAPDGAVWPCGHPKTEANSQSVGIGPKNGLRCRICRRRIVRIHDRTYRSRYSEGLDPVPEGLALRVETGWPVPRLWPNDRSHRMAKWRAGDNAKREAYWATCYAKPPGMKLDKGARYKLTIEAHPAVERGRDDDNLVAACKPLRDGIASALGIDDKLFDLQPVVWGDKHGPGRLFFIVETAP